MATATPRNNPHPARGRKLPAAPPRPADRETTHTPQGDGNLLREPSDIRLDEKQPTPRKGTETFDLRSGIVVKNGNNPHPARGRKLPGCTALRDGGGNNPHPARGRKRLIRHLKSDTIGNNPHPARGRKQLRDAVDPADVETTHTPQGDGNSGHKNRSSSFPRKQPTPRKGTETPDSPWRRQRPDGNNPHPASGRKLPRPEPKDSQDGNNPHPARGRKPF